MTEQDILNARQAAGEAYVAAAAAYVQAWINMAAHEAAAGNRIVGAVYDASNFTAHPTVLPHPEFLPQDACAELTSPNRLVGLLQPATEDLIHDFLAGG
jgi:hypothetical protein